MFNHSDKNSPARPIASRIASVLEMARPIRRDSAWGEMVSQDSLGVTNLIELRSGGLRIRRGKFLMMPGTSEKGRLRDSQVVPVGAMDWNNRVVHEADITFIRRPDIALNGLRKASPDEIRTFSNTFGLFGCQSVLETLRSLSEKKPA